jgi:alginate O-acetyltransferase complex protein AlgJ
MPDDLIHCGIEGWLFLVGGSNNVLRYYTEPEAFSDRLVSSWLDLLRARRKRCAGIGATYTHLIAPEKLTIYHEFFAGELSFIRDCPALRLPRAAKEAGLGDAIVDPVPFFNQQKDSFQLYWKTDTHWSFHGCFCAYQMLCHHLGARPNSDIVRGRLRSGDIVLDLGAKLDPPPRERFRLIEFIKHARRIATNPMVNFKERYHRENDIGLHVGSNVVFVNNHRDAVDKSVVLFGDSFAEYRSHLLTGMLAETFREVHFVWSISLDWSYIERVKPDIVVTEAAERFMGQVPNDRFDLDAHVIERLGPLLREVEAVRSSEAARPATAQDLPSLATL